MNDAPGHDTIAHYRVKLGDVWLNAVAAGTAEDVKRRLVAYDQVWMRPTLELVGSKPLDAWFGPFPKGNKIRLWLVEDE